MTRVYPTAGRLIRDPVSRQPLPPDGAEVELTDVYWARRLREGDISAHAPAAVAKPSGKKK